MASELGVIVAAFDERAQTLLLALSQPLRRRNVHSLRVALRRFLAAAEIAGTVGYSLSFEVRRQLLALLAGLSPLRDAQVQIKCLKKLRRYHRGVSELLKVIRKRRARRARRAAQLLASVRTEQLVREIGRSRAALLRAAQEPPDTISNRLALNALIRERHFRLLREQAAMSAEHPRTLHAARLRLKDYRYLAELAGPVLPEGMPKDFEAMRRLQDRLGEMHDLGKLAKLMRRERKKRPKISRGLSTLARKFRRLKRARARKLSAELRLGLNSPAVS